MLLDPNARQLLCRRAHLSPATDATPHLNKVQIINIILDESQSNERTCFSHRVGEQWNHGPGGPKERRGSLPPHLQLVNGHTTVNLCSLICILHFRIIKVCTFQSKCLWIFSNDESRTNLSVDIKEMQF